jgi:hypothetical protein
MASKLFGYFWWEPKMSVHSFFADPLSEFRISQNDALGASTIWHAARTFYEACGRRAGMPIQLSMLVLPLCFHKTTADVIASCHPSSGVYMALTKDRTIPAGLQRRMVAMADQSFHAILLSCRAGLLAVDKGEVVQLVPKRLTVPRELHSDEKSVRTMRMASERLGTWFASSRIGTLCALLNVRF